MKHKVIIPYPLWAGRRKRPTETGGDADKNDACGIFVPLFIWFGIVVLLTAVCILIGGD